MSQVSIDLRLFLPEAISKRKEAFPLIDRIYKERKEEFYIVGKKSEFYNHTFLTEGCIEQVEYARKVLGILCYVVEYKNEEYFQKVFDICRAAYPFAYLYVEDMDRRKAQSVSIEDFTHRLVKKYKGVDSIADDFLNGSIFTMFFLATQVGIEVVKDTLYETLMSKYMVERQGVKKQLESALDRISEKIKVGRREYSVNLFNNPLMSNDFATQYEWFNLFTPLDLSITSILENTPKDTKIIDYVVGSYELTDPKSHKIPFSDYIVPACLIYRLAQAYDNAKRWHFKNNNETMYLEVTQVKNELNVQRVDSENLKSHLDVTEKQLAKVQRELEALKLDTKREKDELIQLRELFFSLEVQSDDDVATTEIINFETLKNAEIIIVGGHPNWQTKMKEFLPRAIFLSSENFDTKIIKGKDVYIFYQYMSHALYYKVVGCDYGRLKYFRNNNIEICLQQILEI